MNEKFKNIGIDEETAIMHRQEFKFQNYDAVFEIWMTREVSACSVIFCKEDVAHLNDEEIIAMIEKECKANDVNISRVNENYVFANYGFKII